MANKSWRRLRVTRLLKSMIDEGHLPASVPSVPELPTLKVEYLPDATAISLAPAGVARLFPALFLAVWLCGWAMGEFFAAGALLAGLISILKTIFAGQFAPLLFALPVVGFLGLWLSLWTLGGYCAGRELLRLIASRLTIRLANKEATVEWRIGLCVARHVFPAGSIRRAILRRNGRLHVTAFDQPALELDPPVDRAALSWAVAALRAASGLPEETAPGVLPDGWKETEVKGGWLVERSVPEGRWERMLLPAGPTLFAAAGYFELRAVKDEPWAMSVGRFEISFERDSDGDEQWKLEVIGERGRALVLRDEPDDLRQLGRYLAWRTGFALTLPKQLQSE